MSDLSAEEKLNRRFIIQNESDLDMWFVCSIIKSAVKDVQGSESCMQKLEEGRDVCMAGRRHGKEGTLIFVPNEMSVRVIYSEREIECS